MMTLPVHTCGGQCCFCGTIVVGKAHSAPKLLNISCGARGRGKAELVGKGVRRGETGT